MNGLQRINSYLTQVLTTLGIWGHPSAGGLASPASRKLSYITAVETLFKQLNIKDIGQRVTFIIRATTLYSAVWPRSTVCMSGKLTLLSFLYYSY